MRLICPKCDAQYDIADDVIPEGGRDVQCSSCAHTWFQTDKSKAAGRPLTQRPTPRPAPSSVPAPPELDRNDAPRHSVVEHSLVDPAARKPLDSSIADILRQEAAREKAASAPQQAQQKAPEISNVSRDRRANETRERIAQVTENGGRAAASVAAAATGAVAGENLRSVPSIDEINATLRARAAASDTSGLTEREHFEVVQRRGFRRGFFAVLLVIAVLIAPYFLADQIVENLPATRDIMTSYVETVDTARIWLDDQLQSLRAKALGAMGVTIPDAAPQAPAADVAPAGN